MAPFLVELPETADEWAELPGSELDATAHELETAARRIEAAIVAASSEATVRGHHETDGHRTVSPWLMTTTHCRVARPRSAAARRELSRTAAESRPARPDGTVMGLPSAA